VSSDGQLILTDRASIDRVMRAFSFTCVEGREVQPDEEIAIADVARVFDALATLEPASLEQGLGIGSRAALLTGGVVLYVARFPMDAVQVAAGRSRAGPLEMLWQLDDAIADRVVELYAFVDLEQIAPELREEAELLAKRMRPWVDASARRAGGVALYCYASVS
jgi:hypothetical protein